MVGVKASAKLWSLRPLIILAILISLAQAAGMVVLPGSRLNLQWTAGVILYYLLFEALLILSPRRDKCGFWLMLVFLFATWFSLIKFLLGLIQEKEWTLSNRIEHVCTGLILFYIVYMLKTAHILTARFYTARAEALAAVLIANFLNVVHEIVELFLDIWIGQAHFIGPSIFDTNIDLLTTLLGIFAGFLFQFFVQALTAKTSSRPVRRAKASPRSRPA